MPGHYPTILVGIALFLSTAISTISAQQTLNLLETRVNRCVADVTATVSPNSSTIDIIYDTRKSKTSLASLSSSSTSQQSCFIQLVYEKAAGAAIESVTTAGTMRLDKDVKATVESMVVWDTRAAPTNYTQFLVEGPYSEAFTAHSTNTSAIMPTGSTWIRALSILSLQTTFALTSSGSSATGEIGKDGVLTQRLKVGWGYSIEDSFCAGDRYGTMPKC